MLAGRKGTTKNIMDEIKREIQARLQQLEQEERVFIFYACESGSRAWGFPSADSDYDVRFLYIHPKKWYLSMAKWFGSRNIFMFCVQYWLEAEVHWYEGHGIGKKEMKIKRYL